MKLKFVICVILLVSLISCGGVSEEDEFIAKIESLDNSLRGLPVLFDSLHEMIANTHPNLIVRCKVLSRDETVVKHHTDYYTIEDLPRNQNAAMYIKTPYDIEILDVYYGDLHKSGDIIKYYAPYGIIGEYNNRQIAHPIFKVGEEYIMLLRADMFNDIPDYYLTYQPADVLILNKFTGKFQMTNDGFENLYAEFDNSTKKLINGLKELIATHDYPIDMEYIHR